MQQTQFAVTVATPPTHGFRHSLLGDLARAQARAHAGVSGRFDNKAALHFLMKCVRGDFCVYIRAINFALDTLPPSIPPSLPQSKTGEELVLKQIL